MVLEFNCRFGDPETQPILMRMESDLVEAMEASIEGRVSEGDFKWSADAAVCVVLASGGYPAGYETGKRIQGVEEAGEVEGVKIFHAGTDVRDGELYTREVACWESPLGLQACRRPSIALTRRSARSALKACITGTTSLRAA